MLYMKDGYVFYQRLQDLDQPRNWKKYYQSGMNEFNSISLAAQEVTYSDIAARLKSIGLAEQAKEINLLEEVFGVKGLGHLTLADYPKFIKILNEMMGLKDEYKNLLSRLKRSKGKERSPAAASYFDSRLRTAITESIRDFVNTDSSIEMIINGNYQAWAEKIDSIVRKSIDKAVKAMSNQKDKVGGEDVTIWKEAINLLQRTESQLNQFKNDIISRYNLNNIASNVFKWQEQRIKEGNIKSTRGLSTQVKTAMNLGEIGARSAAGFVQEYVASAMPTSFTVGSKGGGTLKSNITKTDNIKLFTATTEVDLDAIFEEMNTQINSLTLEDNRANIERFYNNYMLKMDDGFIVYENVKNYSLNENFRGFSFGGVQPLSELPAVLDRIGLNINGDDLVHKLYNTINGAIGEGQDESIKNDLSLTMSGAIANFLFDDWNSIGGSNDRAIHMFNLNGVLIPLSYLLMAMAESITTFQRQSSQYIKVDFTLPDSILYPEPVQAKSKFDVYDFWNKQRLDVEARSTFSIKFLGSFKNIIGSLLKAF